MDEVGIAYILEKKEIKINEESIIYYEIIDVTIGFKAIFDNYNPVFINLVSKTKIGHQIPLDDNNNYLISGFKTMNKLSEENNNTYNLPLFLKNYCNKIGNCYSYTKESATFSPIKDKNMLQHIKNQNKEYNKKLLDNDTAISKMYSQIKETIVSQDTQIMQILTSLFKNQKVVNSNFDMDIMTKLKENIIVYGPTGTGKTEILKRIAKIYNVPIVMEDATSLSETAYVGRKVTDMLEDLYLESGKNIELAQKGILVIDEFDKLAEKPGSTKNHVSRMGVQRSLLKLLDGTTYYLGDIKFDTSKLSVVALGAFTDITNGDDYFNLTSSDFVQYGIIRELMGRFSKLVPMNALTIEDLKKILTDSNFSPLNTYKVLFESMNINFTYENDFLDYIAEKSNFIK